MNDFVEIYDNAMNSGLCASIIEKFDASANVRPGMTENGVDPARKDSLDLNISHDTDWFDIEREIVRVTYPYLKKYLRKYVFTLVGALQPTVTDPDTGESITLTRKNFDRIDASVLDDVIASIYRYGELNVQRYLQNQGGYFHWHSELCPGRSDPECDQLHRVLFFMCYLNDVQKGGHTEFFYQDKKVKPTQGRL
ncbi:MAG: 2OG-Fe(II) oxygenase, partial [Gammaproteobacteria bacterium]|nr:2OG-Fe(II) oxygenase [Gammaproteobacteria bacterium]